MNGYFLNNTICSLCSLFQCQLCTSATICTHCNIGYILNASKECVCNNSLYIVNGTCSSMLGCSQINNITSGVYCLQCYLAGNYVAVVSNQTCICENHTYYDNITGNCIGVCGDSYTIGNVCDNGNPSSSSGCADNCTVNPGYYCSNPPNGSQSICVLTTNLNLQYIYA